MKKTAKKVHTRAERKALRALKRRTGPSAMRRRERRLPLQPVAEPVAEPMA